MSNMNAVQRAGLAIQAFPEALPIRERAIEAIANEMHDAMERGDRELVQELFPIAMADLDLFAAEERARNPNSRDAEAKIAMMNSIVLDAAGRYEEAVVHDLRSIDLARNVEDQTKANHNTGCAYNQLDQHALALMYHNEAFASLPHAGWAIAGRAKTLVALNRADEMFDWVSRLSLTELAWSVLDAHVQKDMWLRPTRSDPRWLAIRAGVKSPA